MNRSAELESLSWFNKTLSREKAENILNTYSEGAYLLRLSSDQRRYSLSVRLRKGIEHFPVSCEGCMYSYGLKAFNTFLEFKRHFQNQPMIQTEFGDVVQLTESVPGQHHDYTQIVVHKDGSGGGGGGGGGGERGRMGSDPSSPGGMQLSGGPTKEGFLIKRGGLIKSWKRRWFTANSICVKYFESALEDTPPLGVIDLSECQECTEDTTLGQSFCFSLVLTRRIYYMQASTEAERQDWINFLSSRITPFKEGYMTKQGGHHKNWRRRWCVVAKGTLKYYKSNEYGANPQKTLDLNQCTECCFDETIGKKNCFRVKMPYRVFYFYPDTKEEMDAWIRIINVNMKAPASPGIAAEGLGLAAKKRLAEGNMALPPALPPTLPRPMPMTIPRAVVKERKVTEERVVMDAQW